MAHHILITTAFLLLIGCNTAGDDIDKGKIRELSHSEIDTNAEFLKKQIDNGLNVWNSIPPEQKRQALESAKDLVGEGIESAKTVLQKR